MEHFKVKTGIAKVFPITTRHFLNETGKQPPYYQAHGGKRESYYAVCPVCENPIQLIGLFRNTLETGPAPYGRHNKGTIPDLATYDEQEYLFCPYSNPNQPTPGKYRRPDSKVANLILELLLTQFDRVIYLLSKEMDMYISYTTAKSMLERYLANEGWRYRVATLYNLPWVFGEVEHALPLFGRKIVQGSPLHQELAKHCPDASFVGEPTDKYVKVVSPPGKYLNAHYVFLDHTQTPQKTENDKEAMAETIDFWVYRDQAPEIKTIYRKTITIHPDYFLNLIHLPEDRAMRNHALLRLAEELIPHKT